MRSFRLSAVLVIVLGVVLSATALEAQGQNYGGEEDPNKKILKSGLLGAGVGAISAEASGGKAGTGALVGAGTNVIGGALLDTLTSSPKPAQQPVYSSQPVYAQQYSQQPVQYAQQSYPVQTQRYRQEPVYVQQQPVYYQQQPQQEDPNKKIIKSGLLGAGVGAISASASGGSAGKGALIGAGTNVIGGALLDTLMGGGQQQQAQSQPVYYQQAPQQQQYSQQPYNQNQGYGQQGYMNTGTQPKKKIIRRYDGDGNVVSEEEVWE